MLNLWNRFKVMLIFFRLIRDPNQTELIFKAVKIVSHDRTRNLVIKIEEALLKNDDFRKIYQENYVPEMITKDQLALMPAQSFGKALYDHLEANNLDLNLFPRFQTHTPIEYLSLRIYQDHDLWHTLLGCSVNVEDELAIQAFGVAQFNSPVGTILIAGGLLHLITRSPERAVNALKKISDGYSMGRKARFLLDIRMQELFPKPLHEVRSICGVAPL